MKILSHLARIKRLPGGYFSILLTFFAGVTQGAGLLLFVPLLEMMGGQGLSNAENAGSILPMVSELFMLAGIPMDWKTLLLAVVVLNLIGLGLNFAHRAFVMGYCFVRFLGEINGQLLQGLLHSTWPFASERATGKVTNQLIFQGQRAGRSLTHLVSAASAALQVVVFMSFGGVLSPELLLLTVLLAGVVALVVRPMQARAYRYGDELTGASDKFGFYVVDYLKSLKLIKASSSEDNIATQLRDMYGDVCHVMYKRQINLAATQFVIQAFPVFLIAVIIWFSHAVMSQNTGTVIVFLLFIARMVNLMSQFQHEVQSYLMEVSAIDSIDSTIATYRNNVELPPPNARRIEAFEKEIVFSNVSYSYADGNQPALKGIDLTIRKGEMIAFVGGSGAGKSTLVDLICGLRHPTGGTITIDGVAVSEIDIATWRRQIGYVTQEVMTFNGSFRDNVTISHPDAGDAQIENAVRAANLSDVLDELPNGIDTILGENGVRLSGGQRQRLALARALVGEPNILLLDEATSALDNESERAIQDALEQLAQRFTMIAVAHRLSTIAKADKICVIEAGRIVETGRYDDLLRADGRFAQLHGLQA